MSAPAKAKFKWLDGMLDKAKSLKPQRFLYGTSERVLLACALDGSLYEDVWRFHREAFLTAICCATGADASVAQSRALDGLG